MFRKPKSAWCSSIPVQKYSAINAHARSLPCGGRFPAFSPRFQGGGKKYSAIIRELWRTIFRLFALPRPQKSSVFRWFDKVVRQKCLAGDKYHANIPGSAVLGDLTPPCVCCPGPPKQERTSLKINSRDPLGEREQVPVRPCYSSGSRLKQRRPT